MRAGLTDQQFPFLTGLTGDGPRELGALAATQVARNSRLLQRGDPVDGAYLVVRGRLRVYYVTAEGREATLYTVEPGDTCILALTATLSRSAYPAWVEAGPTGATYVRIPSRLFRRFVDSQPSFRDFVLGALADRVLDLMRTLEEVGSPLVEQRVARYLLRRQGPDGCVRVSQEGIATELGTAREVVFRALRSLSGERLVRTGRLRIRVLDRAGLERASRGGD